MLREMVCLFRGHRLVSQRQGPLTIVLCDRCHLMMGLSVDQGEDSLEWEW